MLEKKTTGAFEIADAGGQEQSRERWLSREELVQFFQTIPKTKGFSRQNELIMRLILVFCFRKMEFYGAPWEEFDFKNAIWHLPAERLKKR